MALFKQRLPRPLAVAGAYLAGLALVLGLGLLLIMTAAQQVVALVQNLPSYAQRVQAFEPQLVQALRPLGVTGSNLQSINQQALTAAQAVGATLAAGSLGIVSSIAADLVDAVLILMLSIYFMLSGPRVVRWLQESTPGSLRAPARFLVQTVNQVVGGYVRGTLTMALLIGVLVGLGLGILGVPYAVLLGVLAFFMEFIPVVGVLISGAVSLIVTLTRGPFLVVVVLVYFIVVHVIESDVVGPRVMGRAVGIHPATGIIALLAGWELFGVWGALFASPVAGLLQATITVVWRGLTDGQPGILASVAAASEAAVQADEAAGPRRPGTQRPEPATRRTGRAMRRRSPRRRQARQGQREPRDATRKGRPGQTGGAATAESRSAQNRRAMAPKFSSSRRTSSHGASHFSGWNCATVSRR